MAQTKLAEFLRRVGATQDQCALGAGVDQSTISKMVNGRGSPKAETVAKVYRWCDEIARKRRLKRAERLDWIDLIKGQPPQARAS